MHNISDLKVIGYANVLSGSMLPSIVLPIFSFKTDHNKVLVPPYVINRGFLYGATEISYDEVTCMKDNYKVTLFIHEFPAKNDFTLWIDDSRAHHYEESWKANVTLNNISLLNIVHAEDELFSGNIDEAERLARIAISANDKQIDALVILAAISRKRNNIDGQNLMIKLASKHLRPCSFTSLVDKYCSK